MNELRHRLARSPMAGRSAVPRPIRVAVRVLAGLALVSLALEYGFPQPLLPVDVLVGVQLAAVGLYVISRVWSLVASSSKRLALRGMILDGVLLLGAGIFLLVRVEAASTTVLKTSALYIAVLQLLLGARFIIAAVRFNLAVSQSKLQPARLLALTFGGLILAGTLVLSLPICASPELIAAEGFTVARHVLNCAFTAVSATCVTGLTVYDTGGDFSFAGQVVILILIQLGGLGIMIFGSLFGLLAGRRLSLRQSLVLQDSMSHQTLGDVRRMITFIVLVTLIAEGVGAMMLYPMFAEVPTVAGRIFHSVFHAVSAFCNAGFGLSAESLIPHRRSWQVYTCIAPLIVLGGLGFPVLYDLVGWVRVTLRRWVWARRFGTGSVMPRHRLSLHTRLALLISGGLIAAGTVGFTVFESSVKWGGVTPSDDGAAMHDAGLGGRILDAMFLSVSSRTAGFHTVDMSTTHLSPPSHMLCALLMFVGGSPASTAGGIKTVCLGVLLLGIWSTMRGRPNVEVFGRTIPQDIVRRAAVVVVVMAAVVSVVSLTLMVTDSVTMREAIFETVSACGTTGLSTGITADLTPAGRLVIMFAMFAGRLGPLTLLLALGGGRDPARYTYPTETVGIG